MASILHGGARTTPRVRAELQASKEAADVLAKRYGPSRTTVNKWRSRFGTADAPMGLRDCRGTVLTPIEEAMIVAFRQRTLLPLDDVMTTKRGRFAGTTIGYVHIDSGEPRHADGKIHMFLAIDRVSKFTFVEFYEKAGKMNAAAFLEHAIEAFPYKIHTVLTENGVAHKLTKPYHPWTNGQAERMNRTIKDAMIKDATIKAFHYPDIESLKAHVPAFVKTYNFAKHPKALRWKTPFEAIAHAWTTNPSIFKINPRHLIPGFKFPRHRRMRRCAPEPA